ncbi:MAG: hypothetical protein QS748_04595 [Candidatus Endonucleobacter bathymodioli]|uniref:Uncharacterized protein n=1 Tax=Candidatus Endonucleibacter bathymodioli TaxID=539814 RepID=A0AA90P039_9GAMM|nr:hypothetical protein [Candidatus Endonucleobacter bathymodioli]
MIETILQKRHRLPATYTLTIYCYTNILKKTFLALAVFYSTLSVAKADFKTLPKMQEFEYVTSDDDAVNQLFNNQNYEVLAMEKTSFQAQSTYAVMASKKKYFVKITREDCYACNATSFGYEWQLKYDKKKNDIINKANAALILPYQSGTFILQNKKHLIVSYQWAPGKTLKDIYIDHFSGNKDSETLKIAMHRYGQVIAIAALDPNDPSDDIIELSNRKPQISLDDRHAGNIKYFERNDKVYLLDLAMIHIDIDSDTVEKSIIATAAHLCALPGDFLNANIHHINTQEYIKIWRHGREYVSTPVSYFINGYISALPKYDSNVVQEILLKNINDVFEKNCANGLTLYCSLIDDVKSINQGTCD